jgi:hypothetical protein
VKPFILLVIAACGSETVSRPPEAPYDRASLERPVIPPDAPSLSATQKEREIADRYLAALASPHFDALSPVLADDVHFTLAGLVTTDALGRHDVIAAHDKLFSRYDKKTFTPSRVLVTSQAQSIEWILTAQDKTTGRPVGIRGIALVTTKDDGTIRDIHLCFDQGLVQAQLTGEPKELAKLPLAAPPNAPRESVEQAISAEEAANDMLVRTAVDDALQADESVYVAAFTDKRGAHEHYKLLHAAIANLETTVDNSWGIGNYVVVEYHVVGRQRAKYKYVPVKDPVIKLYFAEVDELHDGKIARTWRYDNPIQVLQQ